MGLPRMLPVLKDLVVQPMSLFPHLKVEGLHLSLWPLSGNKMRREAFHRELRSSQLRPLDNPLEILSIPDWVPFREWCSKILCDPTSSPLGVVADFLISRFDKGLTVVTLRSYRSAMASCLRGFSDGSSVTNSAFLYPFGQVLLFEETLFLRRLFPPEAYLLFSKFWLLFLSNRCI